MEYIRENDKLFKFNYLNLLFRGTRDGDSTKICHKLCDNKQNVLIIIKSDSDYIFGGYCKIGFKETDNYFKNEYKNDDNCFLFSINLRKIYSVIKNKNVICHIESSYGLCFYTSLAFYDKFLNNNNSYCCSNNNGYFLGVNESYEMNGGHKYFKCKDLEIFQIK